jgi:hypothetical protein
VVVLKRLGATANRNCKTSAACGLSKLKHGEAKTRVRSVALSVLEEIDVLLARVVMLPDTVVATQLELEANAGALTVSPAVLRLATTALTGQVRGELTDHLQRKASKVVARPLPVQPAMMLGGGQGTVWFHAVAHTNDPARRVCGAAGRAHDSAYQGIKKAQLTSAKHLFQSRISTSFHTPIFDEAGRLVSCRRNTFCDSLDFLQDGVGGGNPLEW